MHRFTEPDLFPGCEIVTVFVEGWEIECCGTPPAVGHETTWTLTFVETNSQRDGTLPDCACWDRDSRIVTAGPIQAYWPNPAHLPVESVRGYFSATRHGGTVPDGVRATTGRVVGLQLEILEYRLGAQGWCPVPGSRRLRRVHRSPRWFARDLHTTRLVETGVLVELAVPR